MPITKKLSLSDAVSWTDDKGKTCYGMIVGFADTNFDGAHLTCAIVDQGDEDEQLEIPVDDLELLG
jgi:hypothetical protein